MILMVNFSQQRTNLFKRQIKIFNPLQQPKVNIKNLLCHMVSVLNSLQESLTQDYDAKYWRQRYSLKDGIPSFLANIAGTILTTGKYLNVMRECGHNVQVLLLSCFVCKINLSSPQPFTLEGACEIFYCSLNVVACYFRSLHQKIRN